MHDFVELILRLLQEASLLAVLAAVLCAVGILSAYAIFRKVTKGEKKFPWGKVILFVLLVGYVVVVLYATILRLHSGARDMNLHLFRGWREAWNGFTTQLWLNVLLNVAMFVPLGILLPLLTKNYRRWYLVLAEGFGTSLVIEIIQYITARGLFDVDDLFNNTLGAMIGYGVLMVCLSLFGKEKKSVSRILGYAAVPAVFAVAMVGIFAGYHLKEYGNFRDAASFTANTSGVTWELACTPEQTDTTVAVYKTEPLTKKTGDAFGAEFAEKLGITFPEAYYYDGLTIFANHSTGDFLHVYYHDGSYEYSVGGVDSQIPYSETDENTLRRLLEPYGLTIPESAAFTYEGDGRHTITVKEAEMGDSIISGTLTCYVREGDLLDRFEDHLLTMTRYKDIEILTPEEAYSELCKGKFAGGDSFEYYAPEKVTVLSCEVQYMTDTKGFYRPVYIFELTDYEKYDSVVMIDAMK
ncbi:MAG: VanZ family protein [Clostridia bacterium]|nr:VanZ family protein [Clostridia bacterium]